MQLESPLLTDRINSTNPCHVQRIFCNSNFVVAFDWEAFYQPIVRNIGLAILSGWTPCTFSDLKVETCLFQIIFFRQVPQTLFMDLITK
jgi:hypothetical protein